MTMVGGGLAAGDPDDNCEQAPTTKTTAITSPAAQRGNNNAGRRKDGLLIQIDSGFPA
jgi:hypothetical protein